MLQPPACLDLTARSRYGLDFRPCTPDLFVFSEPARSIKLIFPKYWVLFLRFTFTVFTWPHAF